MTRPTTKAVLLSSEAPPAEYKTKIVESQRVAPQPLQAKRRIDETKCFLLNKTNILIVE